MLSIDPALARLCQHCPYLADEILEFRSCAAAQCDPGRCVRAFFNFRESLQTDADPALDELADWLRTSVVIEAKAGEQALEELAFQPEDEPDLHSYCHSVMRTFSQDRSYSHPEIQLAFRYRMAEAA